MNESKITYALSYMTQDEVKRFFARITSRRDRALFDVIYKYGLRVSEATLLSLQDVDMERGKIYIRRVKNGIGGEKPILRDTRRLLKAYLEVRVPTGSALFTGRQGGPVCTQLPQLPSATHCKKMSESGRVMLPEVSRFSTLRAYSRLRWRTPRCGSR